MLADLLADCGGGALGGDVTTGGVATLDVLSSSELGLRYRLIFGESDIFLVVGGDTTAQVLIASVPC